MEPNIEMTLGQKMAMTAVAMERLQSELEHNRELRAVDCEYCCAQPGDPCHTARGNLMHTYHVPRMLKRTYGSSWRTAQYMYGRLSDQCPL